MMTPTREQLIEDIAGKLWRDLCEGEGQHSEALDKSLIRKHMDRLAACLAAPPPEPQAMPPIEIGDWIVGKDSVKAARVMDIDDVWSWEECAALITEIRKANGTVWTREPRR